MKSKADLEAYAIMYVVKNKKGDVIALLLKNGVAVPSNANDMQVALVVTEMLKSSKSFTKDFTNLVRSKDVISGLTSNMSGAYSNMDGYYSNYNGFNAPKDPISTSIWGDKGNPYATTTTSDKNSSTSKEKTISGFEKYLLLGQGLFSDYTKMKENEAKVKLANASVELERLQSQSGNGGSGNNKDGFNAKPLYVVLGLVGLGMLGFLTYKLSKK